jgi:hypothetical protein
LPNRGWILDDVVDLGDLVGTCQRCDTEIRYEPHCRFFAVMAVFSVLEHFLQEIGKRCSPNEHTMGSWHDGVDMFDVQRT